MERELKQVKNGKIYLIPASKDTRGHDATGSMAQLYKEPLADLLRTAPNEGM